MLINQDVSHFPNFQAAILGAVEFFSVDLQKELGKVELHQIPGCYKTHRRKMPITFHSKKRNALAT